MNPQDRQLLDALNLRHARLESALAALKVDLRTLAERLEAAERPAIPVRRYVEDLSPAPPPVPAAPPVSAHDTLPVPETAPLPSLPQLPAPPPQAPPVASEGVLPAGPGFEIQFGRWLARIGVVFALLTLIFFSLLAYNRLYQYLGPWSKLGVLTLVSGALIGGGLWLERRRDALLVYGRTLAGGGLACLYYTLYGATYVRPLQVIPSPLLGGLLLLAWSAGVLTLAERRKSELLSVFAIALAYFSSAITPVGGFTLVADLLLAATGVVFLVRNAWTGLSYLCLIGTYLGFVRQVGDPAVLFSSGILYGFTFWPSAAYLSGAWILFTAGVLLAQTDNFAAGKRMAFLCLNNGAWIGLLLVAAQRSGFGQEGALLLATGAAMLITCAIARFARPEARDVINAYLAQGLALATGGIVMDYAGVTRGLIIITESVFLAAAGAYSRNLILRIGAGIAALLGATYLAGEILSGTAHPWVLAIGGTLALLANAWLARRELWSQPREVANARFVAESAFYILLGLALLATGIFWNASDPWAPPLLALAALALSAVVYFVPLFELPPLSQMLLVLAQAASFGLPTVVFGMLIPAFGSPWQSDLGYAFPPQWSQAVVALVTMLFVTWWPRQTRVRTGGWLAWLTAFYALAMVAYAYSSIHPRVGAQTWMVCAALLSLVFLGYGMWQRQWAFAVSGQILLVLSVITFLQPSPAFPFPWAWWAAAVPIATVFATGSIVRWVLPPLFANRANAASALTIVACVYETLAIGLLVRWIFGIVPEPEITLALFALAIALIGGGLLRSSSYFVRAGLVIDLAGCADYGLSLVPSVHPFTCVDAIAFALFLAQPALLRRWGRELISTAESWVVVVISSLAAWLFVSSSIDESGSHNLTLGWALFALALTVIGFAAGERRQRWCGLAILGAAFVRVAVHDFWGFSDAGKVLTFFALTVVCLGLSFLYYKFADKWRDWL